MKQYTGEVEIQWEDCTIGFKCPKCGEPLVADSQDGPRTCDCGVKYSLVANLNIAMQIDEPEVSHKPPD